MGKNQAQKAFNKFVETIPLHVITIPLRANIGTIYKDVNYRLDIQSLSGDAWNVAIQANKEAKVANVRKISPNSVSQLLIPMTTGDGWDPESIKQKFRDNFQLEEIRDDKASMRSNRSSIKSFRSATEKIVIKARRGKDRAKRFFGLGLSSDKEYGPSKVEGVDEAMDQNSACTNMGTGTSTNPIVISDPTAPSLEPGAMVATDFDTGRKMDIEPKIPPPIVEPKNLVPEGGGS